MEKIDRNDIDFNTNNSKNVQLSERTKKVITLKAKLYDIYSVGCSVHEEIRRGDFKELEDVYNVMDKVLDKLLIDVIDRTLCETDCNNM